MVLPFSLHSMSARHPLRTIDLNVDAGESFGPWVSGRDAELLPLVSSVSLACGFHAGDPSTIRASVVGARAAHVAVGAHPGLRDLVGFGRRPIQLTPQEAYDDVLYQLGAVEGFTRSAGVCLAHAKMHGALGTVLGEVPAVADAIVQAVHDFDATLPLVVPHTSGLAEAARRKGHLAVSEAFPERAYLPDGRLAPRDRAGAVIDDPQRSAERAVQIVVDGVVEAIDGTPIRVQAETLGLHGDNPAAVEIAQAVRAALEAAGIGIARFETPT
jgi:UPF0271 protein